MNAKAEPWPVQGGSLGVAFNHIVVAGSWDLLSVSNAGAFGNGRVILTAYQPYRLDGATAKDACGPARATTACEAVRFLENLLGVDIVAAQLDYGPTLPEDRSIGFAQRLVSVHLAETDEHVMMRAELWHF